RRRSGGELQAGPGALGLVERSVGEPEERLRVPRVLGTGCDAEARAHFTALVRDARDDAASVVLRGLGEHQRELVAADSERLVALAQPALQGVREALQRIVARSVSEAVVQLL